MRTQQTTSDADAIHVLLVGLAHYPHLPAADVAGPLGDVQRWRAAVDDLGVPVENVWLATSISPRALEDGDVQARAVASLGAELPAGQWARDGSRASVEALVQAFIARLDADADPRARALVVWAGHGWTSASGALHLVAASTRPSGDGFEDLVAYDRLAELLDARRAGRELTLVLDTCFAAAGPGHRSLTGQRVRGARRLEVPRPDDVLLLASQGGQSALEFQAGRQTVGAFSWALTTVLGRWGKAGEAAQWDLSPTDLIARTCTLLFALDLPQTPAFVGTPDDLLYPVLHRPGAVDPRPAPTEHPLQIDPGHGGRVYEYTVSGQTSLVIATADKSKWGLNPEEIWWQSYPAGVDFTITTSTQSPTASGGATYNRQAWAPETPPSTVSAGGHEIRTSTSGSPVGWMYQSGSSLQFYRIGTADFGDGAIFTWKKPLTIPSGSYQGALCPQA
ncbi:MAG: hypothetical protein H6706_23180 [Myxococcales bacterium]|nr:hypothetical protein [Myxococcales bacterium]